MRSFLFMLASFGVIASAFILDVELFPTGLIIMGVGFLMLFIWAFRALSEETSGYHSTYQPPKKKKEKDIKPTKSVNYNPLLPAERYEPMCTAIDAIRSRDGIREAFKEWADYYQGGVQFVYEALKDGFAYRSLFSMSEDNAKQSLFGVGGLDYLWQTDFMKVKTRYQYKLSLSFYQHMGLDVPSEIAELVERLTQMLDDDAAKWSRRRVGE